MINYRRRMLVFSVLVMTMVAIVSLGVATFVRHKLYYDSMKLELREECENLAKMIRNMSENGLPNNKILDILKKSHLDQIKYYDEDLVIGIHENGNIRLIFSKLTDAIYPSPVFTPKLGSMTPLELALSGQAGFIRAIDDRNLDVYAAYEYIEPLGWGIVKKIEVSKFEEPFIEAASLAFVVSLICLLLGSALLFRESGAVFRAIKIGEDKLLESEEYFRSIFQFSSDAIFILEPNTRKILRTNIKAAKLTGYTNEELLNLSSFNYLFISDSSVFSMPASDPLEADFYLESSINRKDDKLIPVEFLLSKIVFREKCFVVAKARDISERKKSEKELEAARIESERASRAKTDFVSHMSHEIRTPLTAIIGFTKFLLDHLVPPEESLQLLHRIHHNSNHLLSLINDILDLSKIESGHAEVQIMQVPLARIINDMMDTLLSGLRTGVSFKVSIPDEIPEIIFTDPNKLRQILINIVGNSLKFTVKGVIQLSIEYTVIQGTSKLSFVIKDSGCGVPADKIEQIFEPFVQGDNSVTRQHGGTGLGLPISRKLARLLGGDVVLSFSKPEVGSIFTITINPGDLHNVRLVRELDIHKFFPSHLDKKNPAIDNKYILKGINILLVEDGYDNRFLFKRVLETAGSEITTAEDGKIALDIVQKTSFDIILMDLQMPVLDGYSAFEQIRSLGITTPIIALTAHAMREERDKCASLGFDDYLTKPIPPDLLVNTVFSWWKKICPIKPNKEAELPHIPGDIFESREVATTNSTPNIETISLEDDSYFIGLKKTFLTERLPLKLLEFQAAISQQDLNKIRAIAHQLKGSFGGYGLKELADLANNIEKCANTADQKSLNLSFQKMLDLVDTLKAKLFAF